MGGREEREKEGGTGRVEGREGGRYSGIWGLRGPFVPKAAGVCFSGMCSKLSHHAGRG